jgi:hypothetical protein
MGLEFRRGAGRAAIAMLIAAGLLLLFGGSASAHSTAGVELRRGVPQDVADVLGKKAEVAPSGLYRVPLRSGGSLLTHGADPKKDTALGPAFTASDPQRNPVCATDYYQHVLYARLTTQPDRYATAVNDIRTEMRHVDAQLNQDSLASGGPSADYKVLCDSGGQIRVDKFTATGTSFANVMNAAKNAGFNSSNQDYTIFFDASDPDACGIGSYLLDQSLSVNNINNKGGGYALVYAGCWDNLTAMHENGHNEGAVQYSAPYSTGSGAHCWDEEDVMCYSPDGGDKHQGGTISRCTDRERFDCGYDTYFDSAPEPGEWLATHWNIGSTLNRFITFGAGGGANENPTAAFSAVCSQLSCTFIDSSSDVDGSIASRSWDFGDGQTSSATNPTHVYSSAGTYTVGLTVTDNDGAKGSVTHTVSASAGAIPTLTSGVARPDTAPARGSWRYYKIAVPSGQSSLRVVLDGPACSGSPCLPDLDLYTRRGYQPTLSAWKCRPYIWGSDETCRTNYPTSGTWYVGVNNANAPAGTAYTVRARIVP